MIFNLEECSKTEIEEQIAYLDQTPVRIIAGLLREGKCILKKGVVRSLRDIGSIKTEFGQIGRLVPSSTEGQKKFTISEVVPILRANPDVDDGLLTKIEQFIESEKNGKVKFNATILLDNNEYILKDGNKRTIAFFENRRNFNSDKIEYFVYVVEFANT